MKTERVERALATKERILAHQLQGSKAGLQRAHGQVERCHARAVAGEQRFAVLCARFSRGDQALPPAVERGYLGAVAREAAVQWREVSSARDALLGASQEVNAATRNCIELSTRRELVVEHQASLRSQELLSRELQGDESAQELATLNAVNERCTSLCASEIRQADPVVRESSAERGAPGIAPIGGGAPGVQTPLMAVPPQGTPRLTFRTLVGSHESRVLACESRERVGEAAVQMTMETPGGGRVALELSQSGSAAIRVSVRAESELERRLLLREREQIRSALRERGVQVGEISVTLKEAV